MKKRKMFGSAFASVLIMGSAMAASAQTAPYMILTDGTNKVTISFGTTASPNPVVTFSSPCTNCMTSSVTGVPNSGVLSWSGTLGVFKVTGAVGQTKPALTVPAIDLGFGEVDSSAAGTLTGIWTDTGFSGTGPTTVTSTSDFFGGGSSFSGMSSYSLLIDNKNVAYGASGYNGMQVAAISASQSDATTGAVTVTGTGPTANPFSMTEVQTLVFKGSGSGTNDVSGAGSFTNDVSFAGTPGNIVTTPTTTITLSKCVEKPGTTSCYPAGTVPTFAPFTKVTYLYTVTNTGTVALTNLVVNDDNATPDYPKDDFTATCPTTSLAVGATVVCSATVYPPVTEGANDVSNNSYGGYGGWGGYSYGSGQSSFNYGNYHQGGRLICKSFPNGDIEFTYLDDEGTSDNTYGNGSSGDWGYGAGNGLQCLQGNNAEFQIIDGKGNNCLDFVANYVSYNSQCLSKYGSGSTQVKSGNGQCIANYHSSISDNLNQCKAYAYNCTGNSPSQAADWETKCSYTVHISCNAWGSNGFGGIQCPSIYNQCTKSPGHNQHQCAPVNSTDTNTAYATADYGTTVVTSNKATATVTIVSSQENTGKCVTIPTTCDVYGQSPNDCKPRGGGNDGDGYAYCDQLLGQQITCKDGTPFQLGTAGSGPCASSGKTISVPAGKYSCLKFLGAGVNGNQNNQCFTITYTDGTCDKVYQNLSDWCFPSSYSGESIAASFPYRIAPDGSSQYISNYLYEYSLPCNPTKTVQSVQCPNNRNVVVHAVTACQ